MAYNIGQLRKAQFNSFVTPIGADINTTIVSRYYDNTEFRDKAATFATAVTSQNSYFLRFSVKKMMADEYDQDTIQNITVKLFKLTEDYTDEDIFQLKKLPALPGTVQEEDWVTFEVVFTPDDTYEYMGWILSRSGYDYTHVANPREVTVRIDHFGIINNLKPSVIQGFNKVGVQSAPGTLISVNGEEIRLGRTGTYEVNNGIMVASIGIAAPDDEVKPFIIDYTYET